MPAWRFLQWQEFFFLNSGKLSVLQIRYTVSFAGTLAFFRVESRKKQPTMITENLRDLRSTYSDMIIVYFKILSITTGY